MTDFDDLFESTRPTDSVFADKSALDPLTDPPSIISRTDQQREIATLLNGLHEGYLPPTVSVYGPPGTGKTTVVRQLCTEFAARHAQVATEYVNLKECRTLFSVANEIYFELTGDRKQAYQGLDGVFEGIWEALAEYPEWTLLILDEIDHIAHDTNYDPSDFFYRLLRGEGRLKRDLSLSVFLLSNELLEVDLRLDSRVESAMSGEQVFFPPYSHSELEEILIPRLEQAFVPGALPDAVQTYGLEQAANRWGDVRKTLTLFRHAGETATERERSTLDKECISSNLEQTEKSTVVDRLMTLPFQHYMVLSAITGWDDLTASDDEIAQPVTSGQVKDSYQNQGLGEEELGTRALRTVITDLETMGLVETWIESRGDKGRTKQIQTTFNPEWVRDSIKQYISASEYLSPVSQSEYSDSS